MSIFWSSDLHLFHGKIREYCPSTRGHFETVDQMNEALVAAWNNKVQPGDTVYLLGDVSFGKFKPTEDILYRLNGVIHLINGNHDGKNLPLARFSSVQDYLTLTHEGQYIVMFHFPIESWDRCHHGSIHLHGHTHGGTSHTSGAIKNRLDVGVDTRSDLAPYSWEEIKEKLNGHS